MKQIDLQNFFESYLNIKTQSGKISIIILISVFCFIFYGNSIPNGYALDDYIMITHNQFTQKGIKGIPEICKFDSWAGAVPNIKMVWGGRYRPLSLITFAFEYQFFGENPHLSHYINILLLIVTALLLYLILSKIFSENIFKNNAIDFPLIATLLFIAHPVHTEVITNIKGRDEILALAGSLAATIYVLKFLDSNKFKHLALIFLFFIIGLFSKENALTFLAIIPISIYYYKKDEKWTKYLYSILPVLLASILFLIARHYAIGKTPPPSGIINNPFLYATISEKYATILYTLGVYVKLLFFPHPLTFDYYPYHIKLVNWGNLFVIITGIIYVASFLYAVLNFRRKSVISFGILFYLFPLSVVSNILFPIGTFMSERFIFMSSVGFIIIIAWIISTQIKSTNIKFLFLSILMIFCFIKTYSRNKVWKDNYSLLTTDIKTSFNSIKGNIALGNYLMDNANDTNDTDLTKKMLADAIFYSKKAYALCPVYINSAIQLGNVYSLVGKPDSSVFFYKKAIGIKPEAADDIFSNFIEPALNKSNNPDFKLDNYFEFLKILPNNFTINFNIGCIGRNKNNPKESILYFKKALAINPEDFNANKEIGIAYRLAGNYEKSEIHLKKALKTNPNDSVVLQNLEMTLKLNGKNRESEEVQKKIKNWKKK